MAASVRQRCFVSILSFSQALSGDLRQRAAKILPCLETEIVKRPDQAKGLSAQALDRERTIAGYAAAACQDWENSTQRPRVLTPSTADLVLARAHEGSPLPPPRREDANEASIELID